MVDTEDWSSNSTEAFRVSQVVPDAGSHRTITTFPPSYTFQIFGDEESIFGYKGLKIELKYNASDMRPLLNISYNKKFKPVGDTEAMDIEEILSEYLPKNAFIKAKEFNAQVNDESSKSFKPEGTLYKSETTPDGVYEYYKSTSSHPATKQLLSRLQILNVLLIDGGTCIDASELESGKWSLYTVYKKSLSTTPDINPYTFCGYCTVYNYHPIAPSVTPPVTRKRNDAFPPATPEGGEYSVPIRARISQFLILPPYQKHSLGSKLYSVVYKNLLKSPGVFEITVEDPSDEFDQLRDFCDLSYLRSSVPEFLHLRLNANTKVERKGRVPVGNIVDTKSLEKIRRRTKLAPRQFERCVEMQLLSTISPIVRAKLTVGLNYQASSKPSDSEKRELHLYRLWTLIVKQRLFKHNRDGLAQFDRTERIDKLEDTVRSVELDYADKLEKWERKKRADKERAAGRSVSVVSSTPAAEEVKKEAKTGAETEEKADSVVKEEKEAKPESNTSKKRSAPVSPEQESKKARMESVTDDGN